MVAAGLGTAHVAVHPAAHCISWASTYAVSLGGLGSETWVDPKLPSDVGEFHGIREAPVPHHPLQGGHPRTREEQSRNVGRPINAHQPAVNQGLGWWRQLLLWPFCGPPRQVLN